MKTEALKEKYIAYESAKDVFKHYIILTKVGIDKIQRKDQHRVW